MKYKIFFLILFIIGLILSVIYSGEVDVIYNKAVMICYECIGLG